jgi:PAS domain S-box-containing protein
MAITAPRAPGAHELAPLLQPSASSGGITGDAFDYEALTLAEQSAGIGVWSIDLTTQTVRGTAQFFRILGLPPSSDPVPVDLVRALRHPEDRERVVSGFRQALEGHADTYEIEYRIIRPDGSLRWIFGRGRVVRDASGKPVRYSGIDLDITDRKNAEAELAAAKEELERMNQALEKRVQERTAQLQAEAERRVEAEARLHQAQKMEAVGQLTGGVAHDFNNILQVIVGNLEIARIALSRMPGTNDTKAMVVRAVETMHRASQSAKQLVHRLLAFSRRQVLEPAAIDVNALIVDMSDMIARTLGETIKVETHLAPALWPTFVDRNQLESALLNLVVNARDAMPNGGELVIETANTSVARGEGNGSDDIAPGGYVTLSVKDSGCGIPSEHLDKVLEPFFTTKDTGKGSGLGLSMIYGFVTQSGGHLRIDSVVGRGTTVRVYLPRLDQARASAVTGKPARNGADAIPRANPGETILLVEDNEDVRRLGVATLESLGYRVLHAVNGAAALALLSSPEGASVDLLFTDMILPGGMNGHALAQAATAQRPGLPVLFASGYAPAVDGRTVPDETLLDKPYSTGSLALRCREAIDRQRSRPASRAD